MSEPFFDRNSFTLAAAIGAEYGNGPPVQWPEAEVEMPSRRRRGPQGPRHSHDEVEARLEPYLVDARAGVPDASLGRRVGLPGHVVRKWRLRQGIRRQRGRPPQQRTASVQALSLMGGFRRQLHPVKSPVAGGWEPPEYVIREELDYTLFARAAAVLVDAGWKPLAVSAALGVRKSDIDVALALLERSG